MAEVVELDSDDEIELVGDGGKNSAAGASVNILNSRPIDLNQIFANAPGGGPIRSRPPVVSNGHAYATQPRGARVMAQTVPRQAYPQGPYTRPPQVSTVRLATPMTTNGHHRPQTVVVNRSGNGPGSGFHPPAGQAIRSNTAVTHMTSYHTLPRSQLQPTQHLQARTAPRANLVNGSARRVVNGGASTSSSSSFKKPTYEEMEENEEEEEEFQEPWQRHAAALKRGEDNLNLPREFSPIRTLNTPRKEKKGPHCVGPHRLKNYTFDANRKGAEDLKPEDLDPDGVMSGHRFRCTYPLCTALIYGNTNFMNHVWAHVALWKATEDHVDKKGHTDVDALSTCPQCLARFQNPNLMHVHYSRAHSRHTFAVAANTCAICEKELVSLETHLTNHDPRDAPYKCRLCTYKTNVRMHLFDHFGRMHQHQPALMCPFCSYFKTVNVERTHDRARDTILKCNDYVKHMRKHEIVGDRKDIPRDGNEAIKFNPLDAACTNRRLACDKCAMCFVRNEDRLIHVKEDHEPLSDKYKIRSRYANDRSRRQGELDFISSENCCEDCRVKEPHERSRKCPMCARRMFSIDSIAEKNIAFSDGITRKLAALATAPVSKGRCSCNFVSASGNLLAAHFLTCRRRMRVNLKKLGEAEMKKEEREPSEEEQRQEQEELTIFAIKDESSVKADEEEIKEKIQTLQAELEKAVVERIKNRGDPNGSKHKLKGYVPIRNPEAINLIQERIKLLSLEKKDGSAMTFRKRIARNDFSKSEQLFKDVMAKRDEED